MPIELCAEIMPKVLRFSEIEDSKVKVNSYLTLEVLFASRRFSHQGPDGQVNLVASNTLKHLLDNAEIIHNIQYDIDEEGNEIQSSIRVDKKDEMRVIAFIQSLSQVILNISTTDFRNSKELDSESVIKLIAATMSALSEYLFNTTFKIQKATTSALRLIITHGLAKLNTEIS